MHTLACVGTHMRTHTHTHTCLHTNACMPTPAPPVCTQVVSLKQSTRPGQGKSTVEVSVMVTVLLPMGARSCSPLPELPALPVHDACPSFPCERARARCLSLLSLRACASRARPLLLRNRASAAVGQAEAPAPPLLACRKSVSAMRVSVMRVSVMRVCLS